MWKVLGFFGRQCIAGTTATTASYPTCYVIGISYMPKLSYANAYDNIEF